MKYISENSNWKDLKACNLATCSAFLTIKESEVVIELKNRIIEITKKLYESGTPIILIYGLDAGYRAEKLNENLNDDNGIVYISIAQCTPSAQEIMTEKIINAETYRLLNLK